MVVVVEGTIGYFLGLMGKRIFRSLEEMDKDEVASEKGHLLILLFMTGFSLLGDKKCIL